jgi:hypothetical protein
MRAGRPGGAVPAGSREVAGHGIGGGEFSDEERVVESKILEERRHSLEEEFFRKEDERKRQALRARRAREEMHEALRHAGVGSDALRDRLVDEGIGPEAIAALELVPLIAVAWADGHLDDRERAAVLRAARDTGVSEDQAALGVLEGWLASRPAPALLEAWEAYVRELCAPMDVPAKREFRDQLLGRTREVAQAAGSFLGLTSGISAREQAVLERLERAFGNP